MVSGTLNEPVRGQIPPRWYFALSGLERLRAWSNGLLPASPITRLTGTRCTHVGPGSAVCVMPMSDVMMGPNGQIEFMPLVISALHCALVTTTAPGQTIQMLSASESGFRPSHGGGGNLLARARVVNASTRFAYAEASVEDSEGRQLAHCGGQAQFITLDPPPPLPPSPLEIVEQPVWGTPDPWQRPPGPNVAASMWDTTDGIEIVRALSSGSLRTPVFALFGLELQVKAEGHVEMIFSASEWFCGDTMTISPGVLGGILEMGSWMAAWTRCRAGNSLVGLDHRVWFFRHASADGRMMRLVARSKNNDSDQLMSETAIYDADDKLVASSNSMAVMIDNTQRRPQRRRAVDRALCTILFTDIVESTRQASALGDKAWNALLEQHNNAARREVARYTGTVVKSTGDGLLARFASPAQGLDCVVRLRDALFSLGIQVRAGLHTGECEIMDDDIIGMAVNLAARIQAAASPGEVLVSSTVRDLVVGSNHQFENRGEHQLKGFEDPWRLWSVK